LDEDVDLGFESWLTNAPYSDCRKRGLRAVFLANPVLADRHYRCKSFAKSETYGEYKHVRLINSRSDAFKCHTGPFFHAVEHAIFDPAGRIGSYFVKRIPVADRPRWLYDRLHRDGAVYYSSDFSAFESLIVPEVFRAVEFQLYAHMAKRLGQRGTILTHIRKALAGRNQCYLKDIRVRVNGCRMSGDMCTSLGNGFTNLMLWLFLCHEHGFDADGVVEGDDGLFRVSNSDGSPAVVTADDFASLGFRAKIESSTDIGEAGFCKMHFSASDGENIADPGYVIAGFGWTHSAQMHCGTAKMQELLRAKGNSLVATLPRCPILTALGRYVGRVLGHGRMRYDSADGSPTYWDRESGRVADVDEERVKRGIGDDTRRVFSSVFAVSEDYQKRVESYFDSLTEICELDYDLLRPIMRNVWSDYYYKHVMDFAPGVATTWPELG